MPVTVEWYDDQHRAILQRLIGKWTWEELGDAVTKVREYAESVDGTLPLMIDNSQTRSMPGGNAMLHGINNLRRSPQNIDNVIFVMDSQLLKTFASMVFGAIPMWRGRTRFVKNLEEGRQIIDQLIEKVQA